MTWIEWARVFAFASVAVAAGWFCVRYHQRTGGYWRNNPDGTRNLQGRHMMTFSAAFVGYFTYAVLSLLVLPEDWRPYSSTVLTLTLAWMFTRRTRLLRRVQREPVETEEK